MQLSFNCSAQQPALPEGRVILTVSGAIESSVDAASSDANGVAQPPTVSFDLAMLESLGMIKVATETPWTTGIIEFEGVLVRDLLDFVKADGKTVKAAALDDYVVDIPVEDFLVHDVIIATRIKGKPMRVRENGPLWIIYPWNDVPDLRRPHFYSNSIWQLNSLMVLP
ncbi:molybdopterin-dependent oxidoreductase [Granulosicoccus sp. 3-233]|uniref:molybdopterin-dependent oxidoreductase n=1 Tax=Granulosicoccus sp. 3-233 TaxID=3417969 RepID=UPI003D34B5C2